MRLAFLAMIVCLCGWTPASFAAELEIHDALRPGQKAIFIHGPIEPGDDERFYELAEQAKTASVILDSPGGEVDAGIGIGAEIALRGFTTLVLDDAGCHSICAIIWVSGVRRYMMPNADISVHAAYRVSSGGDGYSDAEESGIANAKIGAYLNELGLSRDAIEYFTVARPNEPLLPITPEIAQMLDLDVYIQDGLHVIPPSERPTPRRIARQAVELRGMSFQCAPLLGVESNVWSKQAEEILRQGHEIFGGDYLIDPITELTTAIKVEIERTGAVRWCLDTEASLRREGIPTGIDGPSFHCGGAGSASERAICSSGDLWALDRATANLYFLFKRLKTGAEGADFLAGQRAWLKRRGDCGSDVACLYERYSSRLFDFGF